MAADPLAGEAAWGRSARGVVVGLRVAEPVAAAGKPLAFNLLVSNLGTAAVRFPGLGNRLGWRL